MLNELLTDKLADSINIQSLSKKEVKANALSEVDNFKNLSDEDKFNVFSKLIRFKQHLADFEKAIKDDLVQSALRLGMDKEKIKLYDTDFHLVNTPKYEMDLESNKVYTSIAKEMKELKESLDKELEWMKKLDKPTTKLGKEIKASVKTDNFILKPYY